MPRIASALLGSTDLNDADLRCWFPPGFTPRIDLPYAGFWNSGLTDAHAFYWKYRFLDFAWSASATDTSGSSGSDSGGGSQSLFGFGHTPADERDLNCFLQYSNHEIRYLNGPWEINIGPYNNGAKTFKMQPYFLLGSVPGTIGPGVMSDPAISGIPNPAICGSANFLGHVTPLWYSADFYSSCSAALDVQIGAYWPYDDGTIYNILTNPFGGAIWDSTTDALLLAHIPTGLVGR